VDKQRKHSTITIKINGTEREIKEEVNSAASDFQNKKINQKPVQPLEFDSLSEIAASEAVEESFDWILPEDDDHEIEEYVIAKQPKEKKKSSSTTLKKQLKKNNIGPWKSLISSFLLAILIGTSLGFLVLKLVISDAQIKEEPVTTIPEETTENKDPVLTSQNLQLPSLNTFIIQGGVFSSVDSAKVEEEKLKQKGVPTQIIEANGQAILILGIADSIENAKAIGSSLKDKGIEVFAKPYSLAEKNIKDLTEMEANLLKESATIYQGLALLTSSGMISLSVDETALAKQKSFLATIDKKEVKSGMIEQIRVELEGAITKLESYKQQPNKSLLTEAQQHLLSFIKIYNTL
jgi:stage II sporulation protein B